MLWWNTNPSMPLSIPKYCFIHGILYSFWYVSKGMQYLGIELLDLHKAVISGREGFKASTWERQQNSEVKNASSAKDIFKVSLNNVSKIDTCKKVEKEREAGLGQMLIGEFFKFLFREAKQSPGQSSPRIWEAGALSPTITSSIPRWPFTFKAKMFPDLQNKSHELCGALWDLPLQNSVSGKEVPKIFN